MTCFCWFQERSLFLPRCLCRPDVSTMIRSYFSFLKSSTPASVGRPCWVGSLLPFRLRLPAFLRNLHWIRLIVVAIERYSHLDQSTGNIPRHPKATEGQITTQGYLYMSREEPCPMCWLKPRIILLSCCHHLVGHIIQSYFSMGQNPQPNFDTLVNIKISIDSTTLVFIPPNNDNYPLLPYHITL